jgi:hypothetical protein
MVDHRPKTASPAPPEPYKPVEPEPSAEAAVPGAESIPTTVVVEGRDNVTAAGEHIGTAPDLVLGPSGGSAPLYPQGKGRTTADGA